MLLKHVTDTHFNIFLMLYHNFDLKIYFTVITFHGNNEHFSWAREFVITELDCNMLSNHLNAPSRYVVKLSNGKWRDNKIEIILWRRIAMRRRRLFVSFVI